MAWCMTVNALRDLEVALAQSELTLERSEAIALGARYLKRDQTPRKNEDLDWGACGDMLCTWRPENVLDLFILLDKSMRKPFVGLSMYDPEGGPCAVQYYTCTSNLELPDSYNQILLLGQMVYDGYEDEERKRPMVLIYDAFDPQKKEIEPVSTRYENLQGIRKSIEDRNLGRASLSVQWAGELCHRDKLYGMSLPHKVRGLLLLTTDFNHFEVALPKSHAS